MKIFTSLFCSIFSITAVSVFTLLRSGFTLNYVSALKVLGLCLFLLILPLFTEKKIARMQDGKWYKNFVLIQFAFLLVFALAGYWLRDKTIDLSVVPILCGYLLFMWLLIESFRNFSLINFFLFLVATLIFSLFIISITFSLHIKPLFYEDLFAGSDLWRVDTLYHIANAQIFNTYGTFSTGLDGVSHIPYHYGSHFLYTEIANFLKIGIFESYILLPVVLTAPLFLFTFLHLVYQIRTLRNLPLTVNVGFILILFIAFVGFIRNTFYGFAGPIPDYMGMLLGSPILFVSDSYTVSLLFLNIIFIVTINFFTDHKLNQSGKASTLCFLFLVFPLLFVCAGFTKISTLYTAVVVITYLLIRLRLYRHVVYLLPYLLILFLSVVIFYFTKEDKYGGSLISFVYHFKEANQSILVFLLFHFIWCWLLAILFVFNQSVRSTIESLISKRLLELEFVFVILGGSLIPAFFLEVKGGQLYYFTEIASWYAVVIILVYLPVLVENKIPKRLSIKTLMVVIVSIYILNVFYKNIQAYTRYMLANNYQTRYFILKGPKGLLVPNEFKIKSILSFDTISLKALKMPLASVHCDSTRIMPVQKFINQLNTLNKLVSLKEKKESIVYVNFSKLTFQLPLKCFEKPFLIPALSGMASIHGGVTKECMSENVWFQGYSYEYYNPIDTNNVSITALRLEAKQKGFKWLYFYDAEKSIFKKVNC